MRRSAYAVAVGSGTQLKSSRAFRGTLFAVLTASFIAGCSDDKPEPVTKVDEIASVFETDVPYSAQRLDTTSLRTFIERHPDFRADSTRLADFYTRRDMQFAWYVRDSLSENAMAFIALGDLSAYADSVGAVVCDGCAADVELRLTAEFFRFAERNYNGNFRGNTRDLNWFIPRAKKDIAKFMDSLAVGSMDLAAYEPTHPQYPLLRDALRRLRPMAELPWPAITLPAGTRSIKPGDTSSVIPAIRERLRLLGDLTTADASFIYDSALVRAVQQTQTRHGLDADGVLGAGFFRALNVSPATRMRTLLVNMERLRWVPEVQAPNALVVNIPDYKLTVFEDDREVMNMRIVAGAEATSTVIFSSVLKTVVMSPTWTVPESITSREILPAIARDPDYLRKHNMEIVGGTDAMPVVRQMPGPNNALGRVKFLFPNSYLIYMHDTPSQANFARDQRAFSHGCIRLSEPRKLAEYLLRNDSAWPAERIREVMLSGTETAVQLTDARPVLIEYFTSWVDRAGQLHFRDDVYGHDARLATELFR
jgi:murein L,D-transpeptidase YcbB/YkuD